MKPKIDDLPQTGNQFLDLEIDIDGGRRMYLNPLAIAYFEQDRRDGSFTQVHLVTGDRFRLKEHVKTFWDRFER